MNTKYLILGLFAASLAACSTAYKAGQTPDDVYFSPAKDGGAAYVQMNRDDRYYGNNRSNDYYNPDDQYLRMMVRNRSRWSALDPYFYNSMYGVNNPYFMGYGGFGYGITPWNSYWSWNSFYNPYMPPIMVVPGIPIKPGTGVGVVPNRKVTARPQPFNPYSYRSGYANSNSNTSATRNNSFKSANNQANRPMRTYNNTNNTQYRQFNNNQNQRYTPPERTYTPPTRTYNPVNSGSSSSGSSRSSGGGGVSRPGRGGN